VGAVMGAQVNHFQGPRLAVGQVALFQAGEEWLDLIECIFMVEILDLRREGGWVTLHVVFEKDGEVNKAAWHVGAPGDVVAVMGAILKYFNAPYSINLLNI
jgi:hypothetical protein